MLQMETEGGGEVGGGVPISTLMFHFERLDEGLLTSLIGHYGTFSELL